MHNRVMIVSADPRFAQVLAVEAALCGARAETADELQGVDWTQIRVAIVDLDGRMSGVIPEHVRVLGICRDFEALPLRARRMSHMIFHRPFLMEDLRRELTLLLKDGQETTESVSVRYSVATLTLQEESRCALMGNRQISLTEKEFAVLSLLVQKGGQGISKQELAELLDAKETNEGQVYICRLRQKLENAFGLRLIKTVRNHGYVYVGDL